MLLVPILLFSCHLHAAPEKKKSLFLTVFRYFFPTKRHKSQKIIVEQKKEQPKIEIETPPKAQKKLKVVQSLRDAEKDRKLQGMHFGQQSLSKKHKNLFDKLNELIDDGKREQAEKMMTKIEKNDTDTSDTTLKTNFPEGLPPLK